MSKMHQESSTPNVLVVDDDASVRVELKDGLERAGFTVAVEENSDDVITAIDRERFDAILLDNELPDLHGLDLVFFLDHRCPDVPVVLMTSRTRPPRRESARRREARLCVTKPVNIGTLAPLLRDVTKRSPSRVDNSGPLAPPAITPPAPGGGLWLVIPGSEPAGDDHGAPAASRSIAAAIPPERTVVVTVRDPAASTATGVAGPAGARLLAQPRRRGTAMEILLSAHWIHRQDAAATVLVVPAGTSLDRHRAIIERMNETADFVNRYPRWIVVLGAEPSGFRHQHEWILPGAVLTSTASGPLWRIDRLVDGPQPGASGALSNTSVLVGKATALIEAGHTLLPELHARALRAAPFIGTPTEEPVMRRAYATAPRAEFVRVILQSGRRTLAVAKLPGAVGRWPGDSEHAPASRGPE